MMKLVVFSFCSFCIAYPALAGISDIKSMSQNSNGYFNVQCLNGSSETVNTQTIADNLVCQTGNETSPHRQAVICTGNEFMNWFYITRISDGKQLGNSGETLSLEVCQQAVRASNSEVVCTGNEFMDWFYITRISDGKQLGEKLSLQSCLKLSSGRQ